MASSLEDRPAQQMQINESKGAMANLPGCSQPSVSLKHTHGRQQDFLQQNVSVREYLKQNDLTFRELDELRELGWTLQQGDEHFRRQRSNADNKDEHTEKGFHNLHLKIGGELQYVGAFEVHGIDNQSLRALNLCMAPGAYTAIILERYPQASVDGISLSVDSGGYKMVIPYGTEDRRVTVEFMDISMLLGEFQLNHDDIPSNYPNPELFITDSPFQGMTYDLVLRDGQILRTHDRPEYRENREPLRLLTAQLVYGMTRIVPGGTFVILLHKADAYDTCKLLQEFDSFSKISLFKPKKGHQTRSTFYLIAKNVQSNSTAAERAVESWRVMWRKATFGGSCGTGMTGAEQEQEHHRDEGEVDDLMEKFGIRLIDLAQGIWSIQLEALKQSPWLNSPKKLSTPAKKALMDKTNNTAYTPRPYNHYASGSSIDTRSAQEPASPHRSYTPNPRAAPRGKNFPRRTFKPKIDAEKQEKMAGMWR